MTMPWSDEVAESTPNLTGPVRYLPPHMRIVDNGVIPLQNPNPYGRSSNPSESTHHSNCSGPPSRGRGRGSSSDGRGKAAIDDLNQKLETLGVSETARRNGGNGINFDAYEDIPVEVNGSEVPSPASSFAAMQLSERLGENVRRCGYTKPTPVQRHAMPVVLVGRDLMACAQTGSGKTAAFCLPIINGIMKNRSLLPQSQTECSNPSALVLSPTRELACQIHDEAKKFANQTGVKIVAVYGGASISQQFRILERGVDILVATPGRLVDMVNRGRISLRSIKYLILDEADRMLDMGFEPQIRTIVQRMGMPSPGVRQTLLFSATFPPQIQKMASEFLSNYIFLSVGRVGSSTDLIEQRIEFVQGRDKRDFLLHILHTQQANGSCGKHALTLVFVETKKGADALEYCLCMNGLPAIAIHGDKVQMERERALRSFKSGATPILVATDVAARGLDIPHISHVINFDLPKDIDNYVHRIGRTGRAGRSGIATAFFNENNAPLAQPLADLIKESNQEVPHWLMEHTSNTSNFKSNQAYGNSGFGGHDFRSQPSYVPPSYNPNAVPYFGGHINPNVGSSYEASLTSGQRGGEYRFSADAKPYFAASYKSEGSYRDVVPTGWD